MKFQNYLIEEQKGLDYYIPKIQKECKPFLKEIKGARGTLTRRQLAPGPIFKKVTRKDRKPLDSPLEFHNLVDDWFNKKFGWKARSSGVFCWGTPFPLLLENWMVFPAGNFRYIWSPKIHDLYGHVESDFNMVNIGTLDTGEGSEQAYNIFFDNMSKTYTDKNLKKSVVSSNEVMVDCKYSYLVRPELIEPINEHLGLRWQNAKFIGRKI
jgi:hypothetical protein